MNNIVNEFKICGNIIDIKPLGNGLINDTYIVVTDSDDNYVLQRINHDIFKDVDLLQNNIEAVTSHIRTKLKDAGESDIDRKVLEFIPLKTSEKTYWTDGESYWRVSKFIKDSMTIDCVNTEYSFLAGKAFGKFQSMLSDIECEIKETIPDFHNMELRARQLKDAIEEDAVGRCKEAECKMILEEIGAHIDEMTFAEKLYREGVLPKRICHCDTKVSNMLFSKEGKVLCVIDLDTVMPSFIFSDYGDFLRTAANKVAEDCPQIEKVGFDMEIFRSFTRGYLESASTFLTSAEKDNLHLGIALFPFMQAVRFFTDYINGDVYYKTSYPTHNLVRTRNQMALFRSIMSHMEEIREFCGSL